MKTIGKVVAGIACACIGIGIVVAMVGFAVGGAKGYRKGNNHYEIYSEVEDVDSIYININYGKVEMITGDKFSVEANNIYEDSIKSICNNGTWYIEDEIDDAHSLHIFGWDIPLDSTFFNLGYRDDNLPTITITIPGDFDANEIDIELKAGEIKIDELTASNAKVDIGAGSLSVKHMTISEKTDLAVGAGELVINDFSGNRVFMDCGMGSICVNGEILGDSRIDCGVGEIDLKLSGNEEDYNYDVNCGIGEIRINDHCYEFTGSDYISNTDAIATFDLECGIGSLYVSIY